MNNEVENLFGAYESLKDISQREHSTKDKAERNSLSAQRLEAEKRLNRTFKIAVKAALLE